MLKLAILGFIAAIATAIVIAAYRIGFDRGNLSASEYWNDGYDAGIKNARLGFVDKEKLEQKLEQCGYVDNYCGKVEE